MELQPLQGVKQHEKARQILKEIDALRLNAPLSIVVPQPHHIVCNRMNIYQCEQKLHQHTNNKQVHAMHGTQGATQHFRSVQTALDHGRCFGFRFAQNNWASGIDRGQNRCRVRCAQFGTAGTATERRVLVQSCGGVGSAIVTRGARARSKNAVSCCSVGQLST